MKTLLIDNHDSFTYNLFQLLAELNGEEPMVVRNDAMAWSELAGLAFDNLVISPGPGRPERHGDFGVCAEAIRNSNVPVLGVCLGHQGLCWAHGAAVVSAPEAMHGRISTVRHDGDPLFTGIPSEFQAVRYHSLCVASPLPEALRAVAHSRDGVLMAVAHRRLPQWGVQFHPESISSEHGRRLLANFRDLTESSTGRSARGAIRARGAPKDALASGGVPAKLKLSVRRLERLFDSEQVFVALYGASEQAFWLDSSKPGARARFSFMGAAGGSLGALLSYELPGRRLSVERDGRSERHLEPLLDHLNRRLREMHVDSPELPFDFNCGFVGYFGYEMKADCGARLNHATTMPDALLLFADRLIAFDHRDRITYLLCLSEHEQSGEAERWLAETSLRLAALAAEAGGVTGEAPVLPPPTLALERPRERYLHDIAACKRRLNEGESYEICLTNRFTAKVDAAPLDLYRRLRRLNPAPFAAYLRFGERAILCSSPERFISIDRDRWVEASPIKGTSRRGATPAEDAQLAEQLRSSEKSRAENLMISDLLRNDLGRVCEVGSVHVPELMQVESYEHLHQLVTTVRGRLRAGLQAADCIRACFPGGSMTGAPKRRTMEIIDELEGSPRGVYSGAIGYLGLGGGCDLNIVIRTLVLDGGEVSLGVGGAIVTQSEAEAEYEEILLKARAPLAAIGAEARLAG